MRSLSKNMCSVRQRPMPSSAEADARALESSGRVGVGADLAVGARLSAIRRDAVQSRLDGL
jgi:hypothetical protein